MQEHAHRLQSTEEEEQTPLISHREGLVTLLVYVMNVQNTNRDLIILFCPLNFKVKVAVLFTLRKGFQIAGKSPRCKYVGFVSIKIHKSIALSPAT